jgi:protein SCO1/2
LAFLPCLWLAGACRAPAPDAVNSAAPARPLPAAGERMEGYFPNTVLVTHDGRRVRFYDDLVRGKLVLIQFLYTRCQGV